MAACSVEFARRDDMTGEPLLRLGDVGDRELAFATGASYVIHGFEDRQGHRIAFTGLDGNHGLVSAPVDGELLAAFATAVDEYSGWHFFELVGGGRRVGLCCDGYIDLTGGLVRAIRLMTAGRLEEALAAVSDPLHAQPRLKFARILKSLILRSLDGGPAALDLVREEIALYQNEFVALRLLGDHHFDAGEFARARVFLAQALRISPYDEETLLRLVEIALQSRSAVDARRYVPRLLSLRPGSEEYRAMLDETRRLPAGAEGPFDLSRSPDHVDPPMAAFFTRTERLFRKSAFCEVLQRIDDEAGRTPEPERRRRLAAWAAELLSNMPERLPPFAPAPALDEAEALLAALDAGADPAAAIHVARFTEAVVDRYRFSLAEPALERRLATLAELAARYPEGVEIAALRIRALIRAVERAVVRGPAGAHAEILATLAAVIAADPCATVTAYGAITELAHVLDRGVSSGRCAGERAPVLRDLWESVIGILAGHAAFANFTPLFRLLVRWSGSTDAATRALGADMAARFDRYETGPLDEPTRANIAKARRIARFNAPTP